MTLPFAGNETVTPMLPAAKPSEMRAFYEALGFAQQYWQEEPYFYGAMGLGDIRLDFYDGKQSAMVLIHVERVAPYYNAFANGLRRAFGAIPLKGTPRLMRLRRGHTRFAIFDPNGTELIFVNRDEPDMDYSKYDHTMSPLMKALDNATFLRDTYANDPAAAKLLDRKVDDTASPAIERARVIAARAELAVALDEPERLTEMRALLAQIDLTNDERAEFADELDAAGRLQRWRIEEGATLFDEE